MDISIDSIVARWADPSRRPLFKGSLIDIPSDGGDVCRCAQGDILHLAGWDDERLASVDQSQADAEVAALLGISRAHSILLRQVNDHADGCPQDVLAAPERVLGSHARLVLAFWRHLDTMTAEDWRHVAAAAGDASEDAVWSATRAASEVAGATAGATAMDAAGAAAWNAAKDATGDAVRSATRAAAMASNEIQGHEIFAAQGRPLVFLPMFGLTINGLSDAA